ncbi:MAG: hypothetical protein ACT4O1_02620 [Gemmatimonadota bacterium]
MKRVTFVLALLIACGAPIFAQEKAATQTLPAGWQMRLDKAAADASRVRFEQMGGATELHVWTGPAAIFWQTTPVSGEYTFGATFTQMKAPTHPEAYGIFVGGKNLDQENQEYGYLLVRGDGKYMIKHRAGKDVHTIVDWTAHDVVKKQDESGKATNSVAFEVSGGFVKALVNGEEVKRWEVAYWPADGLVGVRVNHNLDVHISNPVVTRIK